MKQVLLLCLLLVAAWGCSRDDDNKGKPSAGFVLPPSEKLSTEQEAEALVLYSDFMGLVDSAGSVPGPERVDLTRTENTETILKLLYANCVMKEKLTENGNVSTSNRILSDQPEKNCPMTFQDTSTMSVSGGGGQVYLNGSVRSTMKVTSAELKKLTQVDAHDIGGTISARVTNTSENSGNMQMVLDESGKVTVRGQVFEAIQKMRTNVSVVDQVTTGGAQLAIGVHAPFGWLVLLVESKYNDQGQIKMTCSLNGNPVSGFGVCQEGGPLTHWIEFKWVQSKVLSKRLLAF